MKLINYCLISLTTLLSPAVLSSEINTGDTVPTGAERSTFDVASQQNSQRLLTSGGVLDGGNGDPIDVMNPYMAMKYIIYTGRSA